MKHNKVLIFEPSDSAFLLADSLIHRISKQAKVLQVRDLEQLCTLSEAETPDILLLCMDLSIPSSIDTIREIRDKESLRGSFILVFTSRQDPIIRLEAYQAGADDLIYPETPEEEVAIRILSRIHRLQAPTTVHCGNLLLNFDTMEAYLDRSRIPLTVLEFELLKFFIENKGKVLSRDKILQSVWKNTIVSHRTVDTHIACLRRKLSLFDHFLTTVYGAGYSLKPKMTPHRPSTQTYLQP